MEKIELNNPNHATPYNTIQQKSRKLVQVQLRHQRRAIYVQKCWPGSITGVAWRGCSRDQGARGPGFDSGGNRPFMGCQLKMRL